MKLSGKNYENKTKTEKKNEKNETKEPNNKAQIESIPFIDSTNIRQINEIQH